MKDPHIIDLIPEFEKSDFFFAGIMPASAGNDELILQFLNNYKIDYDKVKVASEMAKEIKEYIRDLDPNQSI